jgi:two-component system chemotaxis response regulator CheY
VPTSAPAVGPVGLEIPPRPAEPAKEESIVRALVVDDSRAMRMLLQRILRGAGFETAEAADGLEALDVLAGGPLPDVALVDWNMPNCDGLEFIKRVRKQREYRSMSLMMVTTEGEQSQIVKALAAGAHEYLIKPFPAEGLLDKLALLGLIEPEAPEEVSA